MYYICTYLPKIHKDRFSFTRETNRAVDTDRGSHNKPNHSETHECDQSEPKRTNFFSNRSATTKRHRLKKHLNSSHALWDAPRPPLSLFSPNSSPTVEHSEAGWPDWESFRPTGDCLVRTIFSKLQKFVLLFLSIGYVLNVTKNELGNTLGDFFPQTHLVTLLPKPLCGGPQVRSTLFVCLFVQKPAQEVFSGTD
jgi:hypothetical protein